MILGRTATNDMTKRHPFENRKNTNAGGDQNGSNQRLANYSVNNLNQITQRDYPGTNDVIGVALATNTVTVNGLTVWRKGEYFWVTVTTNNTSAPKWLGVTVVAGSFSNLGNIYFPKTPELFGYDQDGNMTNDGRWAYLWDGENRLTRMTVNTNVGPQYQLNFAYDCKGRRIQKIVSENSVGVYTNKFVYDGWNLMAEVNHAGSLVRSYMWGTDLSGSMQGAGGVGGLLGVSYNGTATTNCFAAYDGNGNVAALVNANDGTLTANYEYGPFGEVIRMSGVMATINPFRFSTKYQDNETDLLYYGYRFYNSSQGRWVSRDPIEETRLNSPTAAGEKKHITELNLYGFVKNATVDHYDYLGLTGTDSGGRNCGINAFNQGRVSFRGFSPDKLAEFRLINENQTDGGTPDSGGNSSGHVDGFWWKGDKTHWYKIQNFCWAVVKADSSERGFSVTWCCDDCTRLICKFSTIFRERKCTPGFVSNSDDRIGEYPFED